MDLHDLVHRRIPPEPWSEGDNIPWSDPAFSARMLREHLTQEHDLASRRADLIDAHVAWIHEEVLGGEPASILDLACGPGLYAHRLARLGHRVHGIDYSPASIEYARQQASVDDLAIEYQLADLREAKFGAGHDLALFIFCEFHVFAQADARLLLQRTAASLKPAGRLLLELSSPESFIEDSASAPTWQTRSSGLFGDEPYLQLTEKFWDAGSKAATHRYYIVSLPDHGVEHYAASYQGYTREEMATLLRANGFDEVQWHADMGVATPGLDSLVAIARRA